MRRTTGPVTRSRSRSTSTISKSLSQLSIAQGNPKKKKTITTTTTTTNNNKQSNKKNNERSSKSAEDYQPHYLKVPDRILKQLLSDTIENGHLTVQCLDTKEKLDIIRQMVEMKNNFDFKELQRQLWNEYHTLSEKDPHWELSIKKGYARQHHTCRMYRPKKSFIQQRQTNITQQIEQIRKQLEEYSSKLKQYGQEWQPSMNVDVLSQAIDQCVKNGQRRLKDAFDYKKQMLTFDWNDNQCLEKFYKLKPNDEQIQIAQEIWQTTANELKAREQLEILRKRISLKRLPTQTDKMVNQLLTDNQTALSNPFLDQKQRASFASRCSKTVIQCKFNLMILQIDELETVVRHHHMKLTALQEKLSKLNKEKSQLYTISFMDAIEERRQAMIQRLIRIREHKLNTFFDEAPTMVDS